MGGTGKKTELPNKEDDKSRKSPPAPVEDDDIEDGDFATPKRAIATATTISRYEVMPAENLRSRSA
jgi:hypothetical protein